VRWHWIVSSVASAVHRQSSVLSVGWTTSEGRSVATEAHRGSIIEHPIEGPAERFKEWGGGSN